MNRLRVELFGRFSVKRGDHLVARFDSSKAEELFSYLLLHRDRTHNRELLADTLWGDGRSDHARKYLRQSLWQLQSSLASQNGLGTADILTIDGVWLRLNPQTELELDVAAFERTFAAVQGVAGADLSAEGLQAVHAAAALYHGDLLEGWYQHWCLIERERLQAMLLVLLDKLVDYGEAHHLYEMALEYARRILQIDSARERTHRQMMRLFVLADDRTAALRQYERCRAILAEELEVHPARSTMSLYHQIRADHFSENPPAVNQEDPSLYALTRLEQLRDLLAGIHEQLASDIQSIESTLRRHS